ncbi:uncharacterized protein LOC111133876 isoform X3 [Crassostrea virginica]
MDLFVSMVFPTTLLISETPVNLIEPKCSDIHNVQKRCCVHYRTIAGKCQECIGSFGFECSKSCPEGYYGKQCSEKCSGDASKHSAFPLISILLGLCASIGSLATVVMLLYIRERKHLDHM